MKKIIAISKWEVLQRIKNRLFIVTLIVTPLLVLGIGAAAGFLSETNLDYTKAVGVKTNNDILFETICKNLEDQKLNDGQPAFVCVRFGNNSKIDFGLIDIMIVIENDSDTYSVILNSGLSTSPKELETAKRLIEKSVFETTLLKSSISAEFPSIEFINPSENRKDQLNNNFSEFFFTSFAFLFLLIVVVIFSGSNFVRALLEEKSSHIIEILLSSASPKSIIVGKYIGLILIGIIQTIFWFSISYLFFSKGALNFNFEQNYPLLVLYFVLGYLLYTSLYLSFGAQVSSESESQQITTLISLFLLLPIILSTQILLAPNSFFTTVLTYFPLTTAPIMLIKANIKEVSTYEILLTSISQVASIIIVFALSAKYFAKGLTQFERRKRNKK